MQRREIGEVDEGSSIGRQSSCKCTMINMQGYRITRHVNRISAICKWRKAKEKVGKGNTVTKLVWITASMTPSAASPFHLFSLQLRFEYAFQIFLAFCERLHTFACTLEVLYTPLQSIDQVYTLQASATPCVLHYGSRS